MDKPVILLNDSGGAGGIADGQRSCSEASLDLEPRARASSAGPETAGTASSSAATVGGGSSSSISRSGLVAIKFFNSAGPATPKLLVPPATAATASGQQEQPDEWQKRRSADSVRGGEGDFSEKNNNAFSAPKRGRGRPRTRSNGSIDVPTTTTSTAGTTTTSSSGGGGLGKSIQPRPTVFSFVDSMKLPRLAPRPSVNPLIGMVQPNTMGQTRNLMRSSISNDLMMPGNVSRASTTMGTGNNTSSFLKKPMVSPAMLMGRSLSEGVKTTTTTTTSPEMDVLRLISDACDIREGQTMITTSSNSNNKIDNNLQSGAQKVKGKRGRRMSNSSALQQHSKRAKPSTLQATKRAILAKRDNELKASPVLVSGGDLDPLGTAAGAGMRKILPRPPNNKLPLPMPRQHQS